MYVCMKRNLKRLLIFIVLCMSAWAFAQAEDQATPPYAVGAKIWVNDSYEAVAPEAATMYGLVKKVDTASNTVTMQYYTKAEDRLRSVQKRVATGEGQGLQKGKQLYFNAEGKVEAMEIYTLVIEERKSVVPGTPPTKARSRLAQETHLYPNGKTKEEVILSYKASKYGAEGIFYTRKCYYPDGALQYEETMDEKTTNLTTVYYNEKGKVVKRPKQKFEPYMQMPEFPGGQNALAEFLSANVKCPKIAQENSIEGRVIVQFVVAKDGKIENVEVVRTGGDPSLDREAVRVIKSMPRWQPGRQRGKPVRVKYTVPVNFRLQ